MACHQQAVIQGKVCFSRVLEDIQQAQRSLADGREKVVALQEEFKPFSAALSVTAEEP